MQVVAAKCLLPPLPKNKRISRRGPFHLQTTVVNTYSTLEKIYAVPQARLLFSYYYMILPAQLWLNCRFFFRNGVSKYSLFHINKNKPIIFQPLWNVW